VTATARARQWKTSFSNYRHSGAGRNPVRNSIRRIIIKHLLESAGSSLERVVRVHVVLADISHMDEMDRVYREFFPLNPPARTVWSMQLRFGNGCEIECVALVG
jgi:enamine deaminase RidA (YjgF/YER057c/UK114 family)